MRTPPSQVVGVTTQPLHRYAAVTDIPRTQLARYLCWLCEARLSDVARAGCLSLLARTAEERAACNTRGNGRLRQHWEAVPGTTRQPQSRNKVRKERTCH
jgi:hypothetical protein